MKNGVKISIIGAGQVGSNTALFCLMKECGEKIVLLDVVPGVPQGKALDLNQSAIAFGLRGRVYGTNNYEETAASDIVVVTAGFPRKEGMTRLDLLKKNAEVVSGTAENIKKYSPESIVILVTNPLDVMSYLFYKKSGFPKNKVMGMAGILDTARFDHYLEKETDTLSDKISSIVLGVHGENMVPIIEETKVDGKALTKIMRQDKIDQVTASTQQGGAEIIRHLKTSAAVAPAASVVKMIEAIINDKKDTYPVSVHLNGEYGYNDIFLGVPVKLGKNGVEKIVELKLSGERKQKLDKAAEEVKKGIEDLGI
ncbi:MAG: malate dehydrogenase [bacterium]|nr:malate dehydrogenase [bacterium]